MNDVLLAPESLDRVTSSTPPPPFPPIQAAQELQKESKANGLPHFEGFSPLYTRFGLHSSICSHMMHLDCFTVYSNSIRVRHRTQATRNHPESIPRKEYICPLCKSLGNVEQGIEGKSLWRIGTSSRISKLQCEVKSIQVDEKLDAHR